MLKRPCQAASVAVAAGIPIDEAMDRAGFLETLVCLVDWGQKKNALVEAFRAAADAFEMRSGSHTALLNMIALPAMFMTIILFTGLTVLALFMPLIGLITHLSGGKG
jgi:type II secretory pathway component PulF